jgi:hypothetical protein
MGAWRKSSYSDANGGQCVEVASDCTVLVRDTTNSDSATLTFPADAWRAFIANMRHGLDSASNRRC